MKRIVSSFLGLGSITLGIFLWAELAHAETVSVKYWGDVDLASYHCEETASSFVHRVCFDADANHVVVLLRSTYYAYCGVDDDVVRAWLGAPSKGRFYNSEIKSSSVNGRYACR
ncbi:KTSC domain-containing protein [Maritimibacter sp. DP4N28-5]|uniref:KTSC domain-containing protein n=1 Tax=Maritimibacter dapengensis TaxID=2836868 RepID=A0ABS6SWE5_9RHOB|nr:KTSC domain-containing protein [Maritimibacter dapengensis]